MWNTKNEILGILLAVLFPVTTVLLLGIFLPTYFNNPVLFFALIFVIVAGLVYFIVRKFKKPKSNKETKVQSRSQYG
jgi:hypothetical protein